MKRFSISVAVGLLTFSVGVVVALLWMTRHTPELKVSDVAVPSGQCSPLLTQRIDSFKLGGDGYFPQTALYADEHVDRIVRRFFAKYLAQMNEPALVHAQSGNGGTYRFTWLRSFHSKVVVRTWTHEGRRMLTVKELDRESETTGVRRGVDQTRPLNENEWAEFTRLFDKACVWTLPSTDRDVPAHDGAMWMFEANSAGHYQVVVTQVPEGPYRELCLYMLKLSGLPLDAAKGEIY